MHNEDCLHKRLIYLQPSESVFPKLLINEQSLRCVYFCVGPAW
jgi:hypothetical protein